MKQRLVNYDLIRVLACIFVIMIHIETKPFSFPVRVAYTTVFFLSNGIFYMLSGRFNLEQTFDQVGDYLNYYRKKCIPILFPFILVSFLLSIFNYYHTEGSIALKSVCILLSENSLH
ncbi:MAG: acyltransferase family protein [Eubacteriales bacterium]|nr:acyltransferase family protein [Eubacteriales bacterium]